ncbi:MAG: glycine cleavage system protein GcvH [Caldilineales bacterium]
MAYKFDATARYAESHDWARVEGDVVVCGISDYAQHALSDVVFIELPSAGDTVTKGDVYSTVESVKAAEQVYAPVSGEIVAVNDDLESTPELINEDPYGAAWIIKVRPSDPGQVDALMDAAAYETFLSEHE